MRGIFAAGVLDAFMDSNFFPFDLCIGVSAGAINLAGYLANAPGRNHRVFTDFMTRPEFVNRWRFLKGGHMMDLDWLWEISMRETPLDAKRIASHTADFLVVVTNAVTGEPEYLQPNADDLAEALRASSALPGFYRDTVKLNGKEYADGTVSDPIPFEEAKKRGAKGIMVVRSRPQAFRMSEGGRQWSTRWLLRHQPALLQRSLQRAQRYNGALDQIRSNSDKSDDVFVLEVCPPPDFETARLTVDPAVLKRDYARGRACGMQAMAKWEERWQ